MYYYNVSTTVGFMFRVRVQYLVGYGVRMDASFLHGAPLPRLFFRPLSGPLWQRDRSGFAIPTACPSSQTGRINGSRETDQAQGTTRYADSTLNPLDIHRTKASLV